MKIDLKCPKCKVQVGYPPAAYNKLFCHKCGRVMDHPQLKHLYDEGFRNGQEEKINEIKNALRLND